MNAAILLLTDSRLPAGGHAHSGGVEQAVTSGAVHDVPSLGSFLRGRLHTAGAVAAALAAASCAFASGTTAFASGTTGAPPAWAWAGLDAEVDARTASPAQRAASRVQGRLLLRVARRLWPSPVLEELAGAVPSPHHPLALGAAAHAAGAAPEDAALAAAYHAISGPATAAVRLLGLDPVAVHRLLADLSRELPTAPGERDCPPSAAPWADLPAHSAPALDLLAERHALAQVRLFVS
ncbi:urease accessory protein UreF [Nonomuraea glycinis]|uniref:urease accessory protein UreF n=1 Tax=Nonomuraea glycinis TaxID=2047744 RepID=UPI0033B22356